MARGTNKSGGGTSRVRFVMLDAEIAEGDITAVTQAIQNALRGPMPNTVVKRIAAPALQPNGDTDAVDSQVVDETTMEDVDPIGTTSTPAKPKTTRKPAAKPAVINDIDVTSDPPLSSLVDPGSNHKRYLSIAAWFHDHRNIEVITADHIYTCYRHLGWPIDIPDFSQPLRELKHKQYFTTPERGKYAINQLGLAKATEAATD
jgi:hypothetical protein